MKEIDRMKLCRMGTGFLVRPTPDNLVIPLLAPYGISPAQIVGIAYKGEDFQDLDSDKYRDFTVAFFGVSPDKGLPTRFMLGRESDRELDVWHIVIYWRDIYDASVEASWSDTETDFIVTLKLGRLDTVDHKASKSLTDGLALILWMQERMSNAGRPQGSGYFATESDFLHALEDVLTKIKHPSQPKALYLLSRHKLWQKESFSLEECQKRTKTLRNWLEKAGIRDWQEALEKYSPPTRSGK